jgi:hypothetical protein
MNAALILATVAWMAGGTLVLCWMLTGRWR